MPERSFPVAKNPLKGPVPIPFASSHTGGPPALGCQAAPRREGLGDGRPAPPKNFWVNVVLAIAGLIIGVMLFRTPRG